MRVCLGHLFFFLENLRYEARVDHIIVKFLNESLTKNSSVGKESPCNIGNPGSIPGSGRSTGEGLGYPLQYPWASFVAQLVKNLPAMQETWVRFLGWEESLKNGGCPLQYSVLEKSMGYSPWGHKESDTTEQLSLSEKCTHTHTHTHIYMYITLLTLNMMNMEGKMKAVIGVVWKTKQILKFW